MMLMNLASMQSVIKVVTASICTLMCLQERKMCFDVYQRKILHGLNLFSQSQIRWMKSTSSLAYFIHFTGTSSQILVNTNKYPIRAHQHTHRKIKS